MRESGFLLGDPWNLLLLVPVLLGSAYLFFRGKQGVGGGSLHWLGGLPATWRTRTTWLPGILLCLAMVFLVVALLPLCCSFPCACLAARCCGPCPLSDPHTYFVCLGGYI